MDDDTIPVPPGAEEYATARRWLPNGQAQNDGYVPPGEASIDWAKLPPLKRDNLRVSAWLKLKLPPRDYLLGELLCTTSRWLIIGETGVGKTLFALELGGAIAASSDFLNWHGHRRYSGMGTALNHLPIVRTSTHNRSRVSNGKALLGNIDMRSQVRRRYRDFVQAFKSDFGPGANGSKRNFAGRHCPG